ncbi:MAG: phosphate acyltransferase PlsX [Calditrichia bacterium]|nr:phosphate acyltransferase PlsX [Calditrichota bacterium]MCB0270325.1 phosphate acyltransferase PlsX [Calditrichota bacterium]MCB0285783.1 phosphate acyltransferase PlsX [Calditrichota bacterium]MCB9068497.1 phosphate acyltransferase PlsX [Calditrichia bacterium]
MRIVVDAMGGDLAPKAPVHGAILYDREERGRDQVILVGDKTAIEEEIASHIISPHNIRVVHATEVIDMHDQPATAVRKKKDSSMVKGIRMIRDGEADAFVSAGSTGAQMAASLLTLGRIKGVSRPAIGAFLPRESGVVLLIDVGANADCKPINLLQFGIMGGIFIEYATNLAKSRVALLSIGEEKSKGNELVLAAHDLMQKHLENFIGNIEGRDILHDKADVIVTDGFTGNVVLKFAESIVGIFGNSLKRRIKQNLFSLTGAFLMRPAFRAMKRAYDYEEYGGVPLLGIDGISIICHGSSSAKALKNAIHVAKIMGEKQVNKHIEEELSARGLLWGETQSSQA